MLSICGLPQAEEEFLSPNKLILAESIISDNKIYLDSCNSERNFHETAKFLKLAQFA
jgi:hypothetical protein